MEAITHTDEAVGIVYKACQDAGYVLLITADHGNAEQMINPETGNPHTAHTTNPVPFIMTGDPKKLVFLEDKKDGEEEEGALADVAPTILDILGLSKPEGMFRTSGDSWETEKLTLIHRNVRALSPGQERVNVDVDENITVICFHRPHLLQY